ncbi:Protein of unknown function, partial [Gryllus bimaculatus]
MVVYSRAVRKAVIADPLFRPSEVTPTAATGVIGSSAVEHAATASAAGAYSSLVKG